MRRVAATSPIGKAARDLGLGAERTDGVHLDAREFIEARLEACARRVRAQVETERSSRSVPKRRRRAKPKKTQRPTPGRDFVFIPSPIRRPVNLALRLMRAGWHPAAANQHAAARFGVPVHRVAHYTGKIAAKAKADRGGAA